MPPLIDPVFGDIQRHQAAWEALLVSQAGIGSLEMAWRLRPVQNRSRIGLSAWMARLIGASPFDSGVAEALAFGGHRLARLELTVEDSAYG